MSSLLSSSTETDMCTLSRVRTGKPFLVTKKYCTPDLQEWIERGAAKDVRLIGGLYMPTICEWCGTDAKCQSAVTVRGHADWHITKTCPDCEPLVAEFLNGILGLLAHIPEIEGKEIPLKVQRTSGTIEIWEAGSLLPKRVRKADANVYCLQVFQYGVWQDKGMQKWVPVEDLVTLNFTQPDGTVHYDAEGKPVQNLDITFNPLLRGV
jgi:hypothetical protein